MPDLVRRCKMVTPVFILNYSGRIYASMRFNMARNLLHSHLALKNSYVKLALLGLDI